MATISGVSSSLPAAGGEILAEPLTDTFNAIINFIEGSNIDEDNVNLTATNGIVGKSSAQTITGLKTFTATDVAGGGVATAIQIALDPASGTPAAGDGPRALFIADDASGNVTTIGEIRALWVTPTHGATEAAKVDIYARAANASTLAVSLDGGILSGVVNVGIGGAAINRGFVTIDPPAFTSITTVNIARLNIENTAAITVPAGTTAIAASVFIGEPNLTATGTITSAVTVYIEAAPTEGGTNNYALWVDSGVSAFGGNLVPDANDGAALGTTALGFSDLHLATGGVINWANGEVTVTETSASLLTIGGGTLAVTLQPMVLVTQGNTADVTGDGTAYTMVWGTEVVDRGGNISGSTFTAPVAGQYLFVVGASMSELGASHTPVEVYVVAGGVTRFIHSGINPYNSASGFWYGQGSVVFNLAASDTATVVYKVSGSTKTVNVDSGNAFLAVYLLP